jgi:hypothetical protein
VRSAYLLSGAIAGLASLVFLVGVDVWAPGFGLLCAIPIMAVWFLAATVAWRISPSGTACLSAYAGAIRAPVENVTVASGRVV